MKFKNTRKAIVIVADRESVQPFGITRDFSDKEMADMPGLDAAVRNGSLVPYDGPEATTKDASSSPRAVTWQTEMSSGTPTKKTIKGGGVVEYVVADSEGADNVVMGDPETFTSIDGRKSADYIEEGVSAKDFNSAPRNASEAFDAEIDKENLDASYDDEANLAEGEFDRDAIQDVDEEIARDMSQVLVNNGKAGSQLKGVQAVVEEETSKAIGELSKSTRRDYDEAEIASGAPAKVVDFLKQNFSSKKWAISKETDQAFLQNIKNVTSSENVKSLVEQRLSELDKGK